MNDQLSLSSKIFLSCLAVTIFSCVLIVSTVCVAAPPNTNYDESKVPEYSLPPLMKNFADKKAGRKYWEETRRNEVISLLEKHVYGKTLNNPVKVSSKIIEESDKALGGTATRRQVRLTISPASASEGFDPKRSIHIDVLIYTPNHVKGRVPAFIGLNFYGNQAIHSDPEILMSKQWMRGNSKFGIVNHRATEKTRGVYTGRWQVEMLIKRGYGLVTAYCGDIDPDNYKHDFTDGVHPLFYKKGQTEPSSDEWGTIGAWAWGLSEIRKWLEADKLVNAKRMAVIGHSRLGKTSLWAGAQDQNFAMVISNDSGCGGAALYRRCYGEQIHHMLPNIGYWFCRDHAKHAHRESEMPVDQHMLLALMAPRPLYVASAEKDRWADPKGEYLSAKHASPIYQLYGKEGLPAGQMPNLDEPVVGDIGYHIRSGKHNVTKYDWEQYLDFADKNL